ncbi:hypothetical protein [Persicobacter psychrovividus]|uniref:Uncharacterized protein n=1 Tax=Persicobacter psychrovividus TaxID=387638 RepID=A0ABN6LHY3_9BACT|nr:hypothetical protein PEPS_34070 [Persicobacter psychrovividus]
MAFEESNSFDFPRVIIGNLPAPDTAPDVEYMTVTSDPACIVRVECLDDEDAETLKPEGAAAIFNYEGVVPYFFHVIRYFSEPITDDELQFLFLRNMSEIYFRHLNSQEDYIDEVLDANDTLFQEIYEEFSENEEEEFEVEEQAHDLMLVGRIARPILAEFGAQFENDEQFFDLRITLPEDLLVAAKAYDEIDQKKYFYYKLKFKDQDFEPYLSKSDDAKRFSTWDVSDMAIYDQPLLESLLIEPFKENALFMGYEEKTIALFDQDHFYFAVGGGFLGIDNRTNELIYVDTIARAAFFKAEQTATAVAEVIAKEEGLSLSPLPYSAYCLWNLPYCGPLKINGYFTTLVVEQQLLLFHKQNPQFVVLPHYDGKITFSITVEDIEFLELFPVDQNEIIEFYHQDIIEAFKNFIESFGEFL